MVSCAPSRDEGPTTYIEIETTIHKLLETRDNIKIINEQTKKINKNIKKKKNINKQQPKSIT
jgi:ABC-type lipopolysaccharide export system ATPase subunit